MTQAEAYRLACQRVRRDGLVITTAYHSGDINGPVTQLVCDDASQARRKLAAQRFDCAARLLGIVRPECSLYFPGGSIRAALSQAVNRAHGSL